MSVNVFAFKSKKISLLQSLGPYLNDVNFIFSFPSLSVKMFTVKSFFLTLVGVNVIPVAPVNGAYELI